MESEDIPKPSVDLMKLISLRRSDKEETPMTEEAKKLYSTIRDIGDSRISGGRAVLPARGRPATRGEKPGSRASSPAGRIQRPMDPEEREYIKAHVMNLNPDRAQNYADWVNVGLCLHNIHVDLLDVFLDFSAQDSTKYNELDCINKWNSLTFKNDGERLGHGTLRYWSRHDNSENYILIENNNFDRLLLAAISCTEHDVACVIHAKFQDHYKCTDFGKNVWYRWLGHIWYETDRGVNLQLKLSKEIAGEFFKKSQKLGDEMVARNLINCLSEGKGDCGFCE